MTLEPDTKTTRGEATVYYFTNPQALAARAKIMNYLQRNKKRGHSPPSIAQVHKSIGGKYYVYTWSMVNYLHSQGRLFRHSVGNNIVLIPS